MRVFKRLSGNFSQEVTQTRPGIETPPTVTRMKQRALPVRPAKKKAARRRPVLHAIVSSSFDTGIKPLLGKFGSAQHRPCLVLGFLPFGFGIRIGDDAGTSLHVQLAILSHGRTDS